MLDKLLTTLTVIFATLTALLAAATFGLTVVILAADYGLL